MVGKTYRQNGFISATSIGLLLLCGYSTAASAASERIYQAPFQRTYDATVYSLEIMRANVKNLNPNSIEAFIPATARWSAASLKLHIEPLSENETRVRVDPSSTTVLRNFPAYWLNQFFEKIEQSLKIKDL